MMFRQTASFMLATILALGATASSVDAGETVLAAGGVPAMPIVLPENASERQRDLADELKAILGQISGAPFKVETGDGETGIVLATTTQISLPEWEADLALRGHDGLEAYGVRSTPERLLVLGSTDLGLDRGITKVLESLGCRWFFPHSAWHIIPRLGRVTVDMDLTDRPALLSRVIWWNWGPWDQQAREDFRVWQRRNWMGESLKVTCSHAWQRIIREHKSTFDAHPEFLALQQVEEAATERAAAERKGQKFCVTNPELVALCQQYALEFLRTHPDRDMVSMEPSDGGGHCQCASCTTFGPVPERVHYLVDQVAKAVRTEWPGKYVGTYAYSQHSEPPTFRMQPNVYVQITAGFTRGRYTFLELIDAWADHVDQLGIYEYFSVWAWSRDLPGRPRGADLGYLRERIPYYADMNATTMSCESAANYGVCGLGYLVASRLMWNPEADIEAICRDFYEKAFGPAASAMKRYYERFDGSNKPLVSDHLLALAHRDVAEACDRAAGRPDIQARLDDVKLYLAYVRFMRDLEVSAKGTERLDALFRVLDLAYRARHRYVVHSTGIRGRYKTYYLRGMEEPEEWDWRKHGSRTAWWQGEDYTHEEIQTLFLAGLERYKLQTFTPRTFSRDLAFGAREPTADLGKARLPFQGTETFLMQSLDGEPIEFRLLTGWIAHYRHRRPTEWTLMNKGQKTVAGGTLPLDGEWHAIRATVPGPGTYRFSVRDFGAGWQIDYDPGKPFVWALEKGRRAYSLGTLGALYFYVPPDTTDIAYYVEGSAHTVFDGNGDKRRTVSAQPGNVVVIPVPDGQDGRVWCLKGLSRQQLWFYNCPNFIAAHPEDILIPREAMPID